MTMRAIVVRQHGGPEVLTAVDTDEPVPGDGELLVDVAAAGVNYIDTYLRSGAYPSSPPYVPGAEGSGTVVRGAGEFREGDRVAWADAPGSYAQRVVVAAGKAVRVPDGVDDHVAAATLLQGMTAHYLVTACHEVRDGDTVLVHAAAGGVGLLLTQLVAARGATVIATVSTAEKEQLARAAGAAEVIRYTEVDDLAAEVRALTGGDGVLAVYDGVGRTTFDASLASLQRRGILVLYGASSGPVPPFDLQRLNQAGSVFVTRPKLADHTATRDELTWRASELFDAITAGTLDVRVGATHPLDDARRAHEDLEGRRTTGKVLLLP